jgi:DNA-binding beta-propeller fold protein YncE
MVHLHFISIGLIFFLDLIWAQPPNFYITFHGGNTGYPNIGVYSITGTFLGDLLSSENGHSSLRSLVLAPSIHTLYICSAYDNTLLSCRGCGNQSSVNVISSDSSLKHPYGIAIDEINTGRIYISNQNGDNVIAFNSILSPPVVFAPTVPNPRGIAVDPRTGDVYVGSEQNSVVMVYSKLGIIKKILPVKVPIGVYINQGLLYVSDHGKPSGVYAYNMTTGEKILTYAIPDAHPTGITYYNGILYVLGQDTWKLYQYNARTGQALGSIITFKDYPEQIILGPCSSFH